MTGQYVPYYGTPGPGTGWEDGPGGHTPELGAALDTMEAGIIAADPMGPKRWSVNVKDYGAVGDFNATTLVGTDDTAAFQAAINAVIARAAANPVFGVPAIEIPDGCFKISAPLTGLIAGMRFVGQGKRATRLCWTGGNAVMFDLDTFTTTPTTLYQGAVIGLIFEGFQCDVPGTSYANEGSRTGTFVRDNGNGGHQFTGLNVSGFAYGVNAPYGGDFNVYTRCDINYNDVGVYLGPGTDQNEFYSCQFTGNREAMVVEYAEQGNIFGGAFVASSVTDITFIANRSSASRMGLAYGAGGWGLADAYGWQSVGTWFESIASPARAPAQHILCTGDTTGYPQHVKITRPYLVSGGTASASNCFWRVAKGTRFQLEDALIQGGQIKYVVDSGVNFPTFYQKNTRFVDSYGAGISLWNGNVAGSNRLYDDDSALAFTAYTPALAGTGWAIGNGTAVGRWSVDGKTVTFAARITFGSTSTYGTGGLTVTLPTAMTAATVQLAYPMQVTALQSGVNNWQLAYKVASATTLGLSAVGAGGAYGAVVTASVPFTWASACEIYIGGTYEIP